TLGTEQHIAIPLTSAPPTEPLIRPLSITAHSSAVRRASVATRQCSARSSPSNSPRTVWELPTSMASSIGFLVRLWWEGSGGGVRSAAGPGSAGRVRDGAQVERDVQGRAGVGERAHRQVVDAGGGDLRGGVQGEAAAGLQPGPPGDQGDRLAEPLRGEVVQQDLLRAGLERGLDLVDPVDLDLQRDLREGRP